MAGARVHENRGIRRSQGSRSIITELVVEKEPHASDRPTDAEHDWRISGALKSFKRGLSIHVGTERLPRRHR